MKTVMTIAMFGASFAVSIGARAQTSNQVLQPISAVCESSASPIRSAKGDVVTVNVALNPLVVSVVDAKKKSISKFGAGEIDGKSFPAGAFDCKETGGASSGRIEVKYSCTSMSVPEANRFSFDRELVLGSAADSTLEGYLQAGTSDSRTKRTLQLWGCRGVTP